jgi:hypothetical protein
VSDDASAYNELGRRLLAAVVSYQLGYAGVDSTLKKTPREVEPWWSNLGQYLAVVISQKLVSGTLAEAVRRVKERGIEPDL